MGGNANPGEKAFTLQEKMEEELNELELELKEVKITDGFFKKRQKCGILWISWPWPN